MAFKRELTKAVREYHDWHGDTKVKIVKYLYNKNYLEAILVRFVDAYLEPKSSIMLFQNWADGHYTVSELEADDLEYEEQLVKKFYEESGGEIIEE